ncbi:hypothetical protein A2118_01505 [Candidatus Kaiserbacteria bacterium GWA2_50_9]|uniref:PrgI family protein n=1 Tax=Candidatus Kaiserbacteria bacterium GWA2_50_9 TaxID=1798474 RepID=A0A1F6BV52_9BACT|nr:MAG: hypothetical protein A2118_01505 [Candidatus Kaiserbacteria bacterium GWA2_50_9]
MEYQVPQFIGVEDKIIGPLTLKQFIYLAGGAGLCVVFFSYLNTVVAFLLSAPVAAFVAALAFYRINGKPFIEMVEAGFNYYIRGKLFLWKHQEPKTSKRDVAIAPQAPRATPKLTRGKLSELAWSLDVQSLPSSNKSQSLT